MENVMTSPAVKQFTQTVTPLEQRPFNGKVLGQLKDFLGNFGSFKLTEKNTGLVFFDQQGNFVSNLLFSKQLITALAKGEIKFTHLPLLNVVESTITPESGEMAGKEVIINRLAIPQGFNAAKRFDINALTANMATELPVAIKANFNSMDFRALGINA